MKETMKETCKQFKWSKRWRHWNDWNSWWNKQQLNSQRLNAQKIRKNDKWKNGETLKMRRIEAAQLLKTIKTTEGLKNSWNLSKRIKKLKMEETTIWEIKQLNDWKPIKTIKKYQQLETENNNWRNETSTFDRRNKQKKLETTDNNPISWTQKQPNQLKDSNNQTIKRLKQTWNDKSKLLSSKVTFESASNPHWMNILPMRLLRRQPWYRPPC